MKPPHGIELPAPSRAEASSRRRASAARARQGGERGARRRIATIAGAAISNQRERAARLSVEHGRLWRTTFGAQSAPPAQSREEARARANEATVLADLVRTGSPGTDEPAN